MLGVWQTAPCVDASLQWPLTLVLTTPCPALPVRADTTTASTAQLSARTLLREAVHDWCSSGVDDAEVYVPQCANLRLWGIALTQAQLKELTPAELKKEKNFNKVISFDNNPTSFDLVTWLQDNEGGRGGEGISALALAATITWRGKVTLSDVDDPKSVRFRVQACQPSSLFRLLPPPNSDAGAGSETVTEHGWLPPSKATAWR